MQKVWSYLKNIIFPSVIYSSIVGAITGVIVVLYRFFAVKIIACSEQIYTLLSQNPIYIPIGVLAVIMIVLIISLLYRYLPDVKGGGIPTAIALLRGAITFKWFRNLIGVIISSLTTFFVGVPLGNEGPSVLLGTAVGRGSYKLTAKAHKAWNRYIMTGGAAAGFTSAVGAPMSGILFVVEEAHQTISPMIVTVALFSVLVSTLVSRLLCPLLNLPIGMFGEFSPLKLTLSEFWIPIVIGLAIGLFSVAFIKLYYLQNNILNKKLKKVKSIYKIGVIFLITFVVGIFSFDFISTGHELIVDITERNFPMYMLLLILLFRTIMISSASSGGVTGGMFLPVLTMSSLVAMMVAKIFGFGTEYYTLIVALGMAAGLGGMTKSPLTATVFAIEALGCFNNIPYVLIAVTVSFIVTELFRATSINETIVKNKDIEFHENMERKVSDCFVTVLPNSFAVGKQVRNILWPHNLFVLSIQHVQSDGPIIDEHGDRFIREGDILHIRYSYYNFAGLKRELCSIIGEQDIQENPVRHV